MDRCPSRPRLRRCVATVIVIDASVLAPALADDAADGDQARRRLADEALAAPELIDLEVASVMRRLRRVGQLPARRASLALSDLLALPIWRVSHRPLIERCWELQANLTIYDAAYISLAEMLNVTLVTSNQRLDRAPGLRCDVEVLASSAPA